METLEALVAWQKNYLDPDEKLQITFHGGEPLLAGVAFYRQALPFLKDELTPRTVSFSLQSNLWGLTDELCSLFKEHQVSLGTSLDGPERINDAQRGRGYFYRTMAGIHHAHEHGLSVGCICTFTTQSSGQADKIFDFFCQEGLDFSVHAAINPLGHPSNGWSLSPERHGRLLVNLLDHYLDSADRIRISTLDAICQSIASGKGGVCTFGDCLGGYLAVDPEGWIYPCQRFAGSAPFRLGHVSDRPGREELEKAPIWKALADRQKRVELTCADCAYVEICRGGCPYNVLAANGGSLADDPRDPHCPAYKKIFSLVTDRALASVFSEENMASVVEHGTEQRGLLQQGRLLQIMRGDVHPKEIARQARRILAAAALGRASTPEGALKLLMHAGAVTRPAIALASLRSLRQELDSQSQQTLLNAYVHITYRCNLACKHCYASAHPGRSEMMPAANLLQLVRHASAVGFRKVVLTGGEPLIHPEVGYLLSGLAALRKAISPTQIILRTNLAMPLSSIELAQLGASIDQVVVSLDGSRASHDARRGQGNYDRTVTNLQNLLSSQPTAKISLSAVLTADQEQGPEGDALNALGRDLNLPVRIKRPLPLGRGQEQHFTPDFYSSLAAPEEQVLESHPASTCGLGMNLYIAPNGNAFPCYTLMTSRHYLGNVLHEELGEILSCNDRYRRVTVDSNQLCRNCDLRYLCGGFCRAWAADANDPDSPPTDCTALYSRAQAQLNAALTVLGVPVETWLAARNPLKAQAR